MPTIPNAFIKSVALPLNRHYKLTSSPFPAGDEPDQQPAGFFVGRQQHRSKFLRFLKDDRRKGGVFLVTGFRGVGKTSFVNQTLREYKQNVGSKKQRDRIIDIHLTLAQNSPRESDILRLIVSSVFDAYKRYHGKYHRAHRLLQWTYEAIRLLAIPLTLFSLPLLAEMVYRKNSVDWNGWYPHSVAVSVLALALSFVALRICFFAAGRRETPMNRISSLFERCYNTLAIENSSSREAAVPLFNVKLFSGSERRTRQYPVAGNKEIEYELQQFLQLARKEGLEFIFVFDELDKVEPFLSGTDLYADLDNAEKENRENAIERNARDRRQAIIGIIAGLKNFFTTADARFIFIAGNEMFDATLADISDRQSAISSIFTYVFNIESLLKEKDLFEHGNTVNSLSMSDAIELYVKKLLFECSDGDLQAHSLYQLAQRYYDYVPAGDRPLTNAELDDCFAKVYFVLQQFITYLTYRSNGSPKKLIREIHEFIKVGDHMDPEQTIVAVPREATPGDVDLDNPPLTLYFNYYNQYRIGFIHYLYWPFLIRYGRSLKLFSDSLIVSTPYLFDHLIKFHPFAFSLSNLEQVPEVLSSNKTPLLRQHIRKIIDYLAANHIKEIDIGLFDYKFRSRTLNEISYLSRISDQEAAALNYTLDESYLVKLNVRNKIKELRNTYANFLKGQDQTTYIFSIAHLNSTLGDLYFFDQQYDDAIIAYSDAIRPVNQMDISKMDMQDFILLIRNYLKIGLCFEKISAYEDALAHYANSSTDATRFMLYRFAKEGYIQIIKPGEGPPDHAYYEAATRSEGDDDTTNDQLAAIDQAIYHSASLSDLLQLILQTFMAQLYIQEKKSVAGVSEVKIFIAFGSFMKITEGFITHARRNHILKASAYLHAGHLFYFRNSERTHDLDGQIRPTLPEWVHKDLLLLMRTFDPILYGQGRRPTMALYFYILGLLETFRYRQEGRLRELKDAPPEIRRLDCSDYMKVILRYPGNIAYRILRYLEEYSHELPPVRGIHYQNLALLLANIGDDLLGRSRAPGGGSSGYQEISIEALFLSEPVLNKKNKDPNIRQKELPVTFRNYLLPVSQENHQLADVLRCYHLSAMYYEKQGRFADALFQHAKILYVLRMVLAQSEVIGRTANFIRMLRRTIIQPALKLVSQMNAHTDRHMLRKAKSLGISHSRAINNLSNHPDSREIMLLFNYIRIKLGEPLHALPGRNPLYSMISPASSFATQHTRLLELATMARYLQHPVDADADRFTQASRAEREVIEQRFAEYLFCRLSILQILEILGSDYWIGSGYQAYTHYRTASFLQKVRTLQVTVRLQEHLRRYLGKGSYTSQDHLYHFAKARQYYQETLLLHTAGTAYRNMVDELIYLEDDFNDNVYHFGAALDRYLINNGVIQHRIATCTAELANDAAFSDWRYTG